MACPFGTSGTSSSWHLAQERAWGSGKDIGAGVSGPILKLISGSTPRPSPTVFAAPGQRITASLSDSSLRFLLRQMGVTAVLTS